MLLRARALAHSARVARRGVLCPRVLGGTRQNHGDASAAPADSGVGAAADPTAMALSDAKWAAASDAAVALPPPLLPPLDGTAVEVSFPWYLEPAACGFEQWHALWPALPWWGAIGTGALLLRLALFPIAIKAARTGARLAAVKPRIAALQERLSRSGLSKETQTAELNAQTAVLMAAADVSVPKMLAGPLAQMPVLVMAFLALKKMGEGAAAAAAAAVTAADAASAVVTDASVTGEGSAFEAAAAVSAAGEAINMDMDCTGGDGSSDGWQSDFGHESGEVAADGALATAAADAPLCFESGVTNVAADGAAGFAQQTGIVLCDDRFGALREGGALWFQDLSLADPTGTLPVLSAVSFWLIFEFSQRASGAPPPAPGTTEAKQMLFMKIVMRASMLGIVPLTYDLPAAVFVYTLGSAVATGMQQFALTRASVRSALGLPPLLAAPNALVTGDGSLRQQLKELETSNPFRKEGAITVYNYVAAKSGGDKIVADGAKADMWGLESEADETKAEKEAEKDAVSLRRATVLFNMASVLRAPSRAGAMAETADAAVDPKAVARAVGLLRRVLLLRTGVAAAASGEPWAKLTGSAVVDLAHAHYHLGGALEEHAVATSRAGAAGKKEMKEGTEEGTGEEVGEGTEMCGAAAMSEAAAQYALAARAYAVAAGVDPEIVGCKPLRPRALPLWVPSRRGSEGGVLLAAHEEARERAEDATAAADDMT